MLGMNIHEWLPLALEQQLQDDIVILRNELFYNVTEATKEQLSWGINVATEMANIRQWDTPLWEGVIKGFSTATMDEHTLVCVVTVLSDTKLHKIHGNTLANAILYMK